MTERATLSGSPVPAPIPPEAKKVLSGLEQLRAIRNGKLGVAPMQALKMRQTPLSAARQRGA
jgi:hypothetical protein